MAVWDWAMQTFPFHLNGSNIDPMIGKLDKQFTKNMELATEVHIMNHCPCGETVIESYKGVDSSEKQYLRESLLVYLKGSKEQQEKLRIE